jgi:uncharacterized protein (DUF1778 family)
MIHVYVTEEEKELIELKAKSKKMSVSRFLLYLALNADQNTVTEKREVVKKPEAEPQIPPPPSDGVQRGFVLHPSKAGKK